MRLNRTSELKVMTIWIAQELPLFNFERLNILSARIGPLCESNSRVKSYDHLNFSRAFVVQFCASRYIMRLNRTSEWIVMTIWISRDLPWFNFEHLDILYSRIETPCEKLWPFEFLQSFRCTISSVTIYYEPKLDIRVKSYDNLNCSRDSIVQFQASRYIIRPHQTSEIKVTTIWISRELSLFNFERLHILCAWIGSPSE